MTGYGQGQHQSPTEVVTAFIKTLNHKYLDIKVSGLEAHPALELKVQELVSGNFSRGRVEVRIGIEQRGISQISINREVAQAHATALQQLIKDLKLSDLGVSLETLLKLEGVLRSYEEPEAELWNRIEPALREAITQAQASRQREGRLLTEELTKLLAMLESELEEIERGVPAVKQLYKERLIERVRELTNIELDEGRLELEAAIFAERADITEEIARLRMHLKAAREALSDPEPAGRLLDFLAQELAREANTISAKAKDAQIAARVLEMKSLIEKFREQARNVE